MEDFSADFMAEKWVLCCVEIKDVRHAANSVQDKLFILFNTPSINSLADLGNEITEQVSWHCFELFESHAFFC